MQHRLILASSSRYRAELLARLQLPFEQASPDIDETPAAGESAAQTSLRLAIAKARVLAPRFANTLVIGSDQVALLNGTQIGKPGGFEAAMVQLQQMRGQSLTFHTALALLNTASGEVRTHTDVTAVRMRAYSDDEIVRYLERDEPYDCAGSAKCEGLGITMIDTIDSSDPTALIGLPLIALCTMLRAEGVTP
ncbi:Maf family nucleotide pyrophosphatase [Chitinibacteraceae bacterium HSL-7]